MNGTLGGPYVNLQGEWLGAPDAVLYGMSAAGQYKAILVSLNAPNYDADTNVRPASRTFPLLFGRSRIVRDNSKIGMMACCCQYALMMPAI